MKNSCITNFATSDSINYTFTVTPSGDGEVKINLATNGKHERRRGT
ncbi:hypothetical protein ACQKLP_12715 [Chitinophaga sp. NPDC101104]